MTFRRTLIAPARCGFSLVELSIVLVILGLLVGGILSGQSLIRAAELRSVTTDMSKYSAAFYSFRDKYFALPGDMNNAVKFWGAAAGGTADGMDATCAALTTASTTATTCNGDGNGQISDFVYSNLGYEMYRAWQHLANAGLVEGRYIGVSNYGNAYVPAPGVDSPRPRLGSASYRLRYIGSFGGDANFWPSNYGHVMDVTGTVQTLILTPSELWNIDTKLDDGNPAQGKVMAWRYSGGTAGINNCTTSDTQATTAYNLSYTSITCAFLFKMGF